MSCTQASAKDWKLSWSQEFNDGSVPDSSVWNYEDTAPYKNAELQHYLAHDTSLVRVKNGCLVIEAKYRNQRYESASLYTLGKKCFQYGKIEARIKLPQARGIWPAFWMLGEDIAEAGWPMCGEIDIMEFVGFQPNRVYANIHCKDYNHTIGTNKGDSINVDKASEDFHLYALEWTTTQLDFFVDGECYFSFKMEDASKTKWPFDTPHYLILNVAVGGNWGGKYGIDKSAFPQKMLVDYVRYYSRKNESHEK